MHRRALILRDARALGNGEYPCKLNCADVGVKLKRTGNRFSRGRRYYVRMHRGDALVRCSGPAKAWVPRECARER